MINLFKKATTVQSVYDVFVKDLNAVVQTQKRQAEKALTKQKKLEAKLDAAKAVEVGANNEIQMAENAIGGIRTLLGLQEVPDTVQIEQSEE